MSLLKKIGLALVGLNLLTVFFIMHFYTPQTPDHKLSSVTSNNENQQTASGESYSFANPSYAYELLTQLDVFSTVPLDAIKGAKYKDWTWWNLEEGYNYCEKHRELFVKDPQIIFGETKFGTNFIEIHQIRNSIIPKAGVNLSPLFEWDYGKRVRVNETQLPINIFLTMEDFYSKRQVGHDFACLTQAHNHIPLHDALYQKDLICDAISNYSKQYEARPECLKPTAYFPKTFNLQHKEDCLRFFQEFDSPKYNQLKEERKVVYYRKIGKDAHQGRGVFLVDEKEEEFIRNLYENGTKCGEIKQNFLIQENIHNPLLLDNRKFHLRTYLLIASTNPIIAFYHEGYARLSANEYNDSSIDKRTFVTNAHVFDYNPKFENMTAEEINDYTAWSFEKIADYLEKTGKVEDAKDWLHNYFNKNMKKVMVHLMRMTGDSFFKISSVFEIFGVDFLMDADLNLWFIEANAKPALTGSNSLLINLFDELLIDSFNIVRGLMKSRAKRIIQFINKNTVEQQQNLNLEEKRREFKLLSQNYFEEEFLPRKNNSLQPLVDESKIGSSKYFNLLPVECL